MEHTIIDAEEFERPQARRQTPPEEQEQYHQQNDNGGNQPDRLFDHDDDVLDARENN